MQTICRYPQQALQDFRQRHAVWLDLLEDNDGVAYSLPAAQIDSCLRLFNLHDDQVSAERSFAELCKEHTAIGVCGVQFVRTSLLTAPPPWPSKLDLSEFLALGWTESDIASVRSCTDPTARIHDRLRASAGRLIGMPAFLNAKSHLRRLWHTIPSATRPIFPIARSMKLASQGDLKLKPAPEPLLRFCREFDEFCDHWAILGLATWFVPDVKGPLWSPGIDSDDAARHGAQTLTTPWHFAAFKEDGVGEIVLNEHRRRAAKRGIQDYDGWEAYAGLFEVYYWENVLTERYGRSQRVKAFVTQLEMAIGEILSNSQDRVHELRKRLRALQAGRAQSLRRPR